MPAPAIIIGFGLPFEAAIEEAHALGVLLPEEYYALKSGEYRRAATTVSGLTTLEQIQAVVDSFDRVISGGQTVDEWVRWALEQNWGLSRARLETIIRTNVQTAYSAGQWVNFEKNKKFLPYLMWSAINDSRVRPAHLAMDGYIAHIDDPIWKVWHPPAGYNCRCTQIALTEKQALARGYGKQDRPDVKPDAGFGETIGVLDALKGVIAKLKALCEAFTFSGTRKEQPLWCKDDGELSLERIERGLEDRYRLNPPEAIAISEFAFQAAADATRHAMLRLAPLQNAAAIYAATGIVLVEFEHVLDTFGIRHALKSHGTLEAEAARGQRAIAPIDFTRVSEILAEPDEIYFVGHTRHLDLPLIHFVKRIGTEIYHYTVEVRQGRQKLVAKSLWVVRGGQ